MNAYPSWIHRIPEMIGDPGAGRPPNASTGRRQSARLTCVLPPPKRCYAVWARNVLVISRTVLMARFAGNQEHPDWKWEVERRRAIRDLVETTRPGPPRRSVVPLTAELRRNPDQICVTECRRQLSCYPARSLSTARIWSISCSNWFNSPKHWTTITKLCSGALNWHRCAAQPAWRWLPLLRSCAPRSRGEADRPSVVTGIRTLVGRYRSFPPVSPSSNRATDR